MHASGTSYTGNLCFRDSESQDVTAQILVLDDICQLLGDVRGIHFDELLSEIRCLEREFIEDALEDGMEAACADVLGLLVDGSGETSDGFDGIVGEMKLQTFCFEKRDVLLDERVFGFRENADEVFFLERLKFNANGKAALKLGDEIGGLSDVERASSDLENVIGAIHAVPGVYRGAFDDREDIALNSFAGNIRAMA